MSKANSDNESRKRSVDVRALVKGALVGAAVTAGFLVVVGVLVYRQSVPRLEHADFDAALKRWEANRPASYDCEIVIFGNRPGKVEVQVRGGQVQKMVRDGITPRERRTWDAWSVEGMFDTIERELEMAETPNEALGGAAPPLLYARFDEKLGYPVIFRRSVSGAQQEMAWEVTRFAVVQ